MKTPNEGQKDQIKSLNAPKNLMDIIRGSLMQKIMILGLGLSIMGPSVSKADEPRYEDPYYQKIKRDIDAELRGSERMIPLANNEKLSEDEIETMDKAMHIFFKHYLHMDFWGHLAGKGKKEEYEKVLLLAMQNRDKLYYENNNGVITIKFYQEDKEEEVGVTDAKGVVKKEKRTFTIVKKRSDKIGDLQPTIIQIDGEQIVQINDTEIDHDYIRNFEEEWKTVLEKIKVITTKIINLKRARSNPSVEKPIISEAERQWYEKYSFELPRRLRELLYAKSGSSLRIDQLTSANQHGLNNMELMVLNELDRLLKNHPNSFEDLKKGKTPQLVVARRVKIEGYQQETPERVVEIAWMNGKRAWKTFARFSIDGFLLDPSSWSEVDTRKKPFAETYKTKMEAESTKKP